MVVSDKLKQVDAWLFDLGNVVVGIDFERALAHWAAASGAKLAELRERFHFDESYERHERGQIEGSQYFASLRSMLDIDLTEAQMAAGWNAIYTGSIADVTELLPALATARPLYAFTNTNVTHHAAWSQLYAHELRSFRKVFLSSSLGLRKPEPEAFAAVADEIGVSLERILFFDDTEENVLGARAVGMQAVQVNSAADVVRAVTPYLKATDK